MFCQVSSTLNQTFGNLQKGSVSYTLCSLVLLEGLSLALLPLAEVRISHSRLRVGKQMHDAELGPSRSCLLLAMLVEHVKTLEITKGYLVLV